MPSTTDPDHLFVPCDFFRSEVTDADGRTVKVPGEAVIACLDGGPAYKAAVLGRVGDRYRVSVGGVTLWVRASSPNALPRPAA